LYTASKNKSVSQLSTAFLMQTLGRKLRGKKHSRVKTLMF